MTYVGKMADKISIGMAFSNMQDGNPEGEAFVSQIIADTKTACIETGEYYFSRYDPLTLDDYKTAITSVKVREQNNG